MHPLLAIMKFDPLVSATLPSKFSNNVTAFLLAK